MNQNEKRTKPEKIGSKSRRFSVYAAVLAALSLAVAVPVNLLASRLNVIWDMTPASLYELSDKTKAYLDSLDTTVDMYFLMDMDYLATDDNSMALYYTLKGYSEYDCIRFTDFDPDANPEMLSQINPDGHMSLSNGDIIITDGTSTKRVRADKMYRYDVSYDDAGNRIVEAAYFTGENPITGAIRSVAEGRESAVYFLTGHGEKSLDADFTYFRNNLETLNYKAEELNLAAAEAVPEDAEIILAAAPQYDISNDEARKIRDYLDGGGSIAFLMSPNQSETEYKNITGIMEDFGIGMDYDIVAETDSDLCWSGNPYKFQASIVPADDDDSNAIHIADEVYSMVQNQGYYAIMQNTRSFYPILGVSDSSLQLGALMQTYSDAADELGNATATAVGEPYGGSRIDAIAGYPLNLAMYSTSRSRNEAKVIVFGSADFIDDEHVSDPSMLVTLNLFLSSMTWMYNSDLDLDMGIQDKAKDYDYMIMNSEAAANSVLISFFAVPCAVALIGVGVWLKRRFA